MKTLAMAIGLSAGLLSMTACADNYSDRSASFYGQPAAYEGGPAAVGYDGYYDDYYGAFYDGYWAGDGGYYYTDAPGHPYVRDTAGHFRHDSAGGFHAVHGRQHNQDPR
jgi:hypothetical protein